MSKDVIHSAHDRVQEFLDWLGVPENATDVRVFVPLNGVVEVSYHAKCICMEDKNDGDVQQQEKNA